MTFTTESLPTPPPLEQPVSIEFNYGGQSWEIGCIALAIHTVCDPPDFPQTECIYARTVAGERAGPEFDTDYYLVPLQYVTSVRMGFLDPGMKFKPVSRMLFMTPDKPAPKNRMPEDRLRNRLSEFGVAV